MMEEIAKALFNAPVASLLLFSGIALVLIGVVGNVAGKIEPGPYGRVAAGVFGFLFVVIALYLNYLSNPANLPTLQKDEKHQQEYQVQQGEEQKRREEEQARVEQKRREEEQAQAEQKRREEEQAQAEQKRREQELRSAQKPVQQEDRLQQLISNSLSGNEQVIARVVQEIESQPKPARGDRKRARDLNREGLDALQNGRPDQAAYLFEKAYQADNGDAEILDNVGIAYIRKFDFQKAEYFILKALELNPRRASSWFNMGRAYAEEGDEKKALGAYLNAYRWSTNREKMIQSMTELSESNPDPKVREVIKKALNLIQPMQ